MKTFSELSTAAESVEELIRFRSVLAKAKSEPLEWQSGWYPYDSLSSWAVIAPLLEAHLPHLQHTLRLRPVADIGCGDGDVSFFLEQMGCKVTAIDKRWSNFNMMRGVCALKQRLSSHVRIEEMDLDAAAALPDQDYGLALLFGILYHLKNPFFVLENLSRRTRYCLLSTRIAAVTPAGVPMKDESLAYLLGEGEANNDSTNFWIFSEAGLSRLLNRTFWQVLGAVNIGCLSGSNPVSNEADERRFVFLRSMVHSAPVKLDLLEGWHPPGPEGWCWVDSSFGINVLLLEPGGAPEFNLSFTLPQHLADSLPVTFSCRANGLPLEERRYTKVGGQGYRVNLPTEIDRSKPIRLDFKLHHRNQKPDLPDHRALIVSWRNDVTGTDKPINFWIA